MKKVIKNKVWQPPNPALHKFYVLNFGKEQGLVNDPLEFEFFYSRIVEDCEILRRKYVETKDKKYWR